MSWSKGPLWGKFELRHTVFKTQTHLMPQDWLPFPLPWAHISVGFFISLLTTTAPGHMMHVTSSEVVTEIVCCVCNKCRQNCNLQLHVCAESYRGIKLASCYRGLRKKMSACFFLFSLRRFNRRHVQRKGTRVEEVSISLMLHARSSADVQLSRFHFNKGGLSNGCRAVLNIVPLYIKMLHVWRTQRLLCPAEKATCFCFSSSPSLPLRQLSMSHLRPPSCTNIQARTLRNTRMKTHEQPQCHPIGGVHLVDKAGKIKTAFCFSCKISYSCGTVLMQTHQKETFLPWMWLHVSRKMTKATSRPV